MNNSFLGLLFLTISVATLSALAADPPPRETVQTQDEAVQFTVGEVPDDVTAKVELDDGKNKGGTVKRDVKEFLRQKRCLDVIIFNVGDPHIDAVKDRVAAIAGYNPQRLERVQRVIAGPNATDLYRAARPFFWGLVVKNIERSEPDDPDAPPVYTFRVYPEGGYMVKPDGSINMLIFQQPQKDIPGGFGYETWKLQGATLELVNDTTAFMVMY